MAQDLMERDEALQQLKFHLRRAQDHMSKYANAHRVPFKIKGDWEYLKIRPYRQSSMPIRLHPKLAAKYYGPCLVNKQVGAVAFQLQLPEGARIHPVFHASWLKLAIGNHSAEAELSIELQDQSPGLQPYRVEYQNITARR